MNTKATIETKIQNERILSLDALRGFCMFWIIGADSIVRALPAVQDIPFTRLIAGQLEHPIWDGFTFYDVIFPLFFFIIGVVFPFSLLKRAERGQSRRQLTLHIVRRSLILVLLGLLVGGVLKLDFSQMRWMGVLQRIGLCYLLVSLLVLNTKRRTQIVLFVVVLLAYWTAMMLVPVPGFGAGNLTAEGNLHSYLDQQILAKILHSKFSPRYYGFGDSNGVLGTFTAACSMLLGVFAGYWLKSPNAGRKKVLGLMAGGVACLVTGYLWGLVFPINKHIWNSPYVLYAGGWCLLLLSFFYWAIDVKGYAKWTFFFTVIGMNAIFIYVAQQIIDFGKIADVFLGGVAAHAGFLGPLILPCGVLAAKWLLLRYMYHKGIFFKV